ncbi:MAG TPA: hypothetical protein IAB01_04970 [Candidatus Avidesulfovibrio excrementigallinarum]|nr:hypothetical protein [Candidatus Avidesulfovibrio excrementigallinarum]
MQNLSATFLSSAACAGGVACLARAVLAVRKPYVPHFTINRFQRVLLAAGLLCALSTFLFLPAGTFPACLPCGASMLCWTAAFGLGCAALALLPGTERTARLLAVPALLAAGYALCGWYAFRHGLPGHFWQLERFVAVPLPVWADGLARAGVLCLACAATLGCAAGLTARSAFPFLATCLQLAAAQYIACLFVPLLPSRLPELAPLTGLMADVLACWAYTGLLLLIMYAVRQRVPVWVPWLLTAAGLVCLLAG